VRNIGAWGARVVLPPSLVAREIEVIIAMDDRAEFTSGANAVSETSERRETRDDRAE
jgi:hypothetical protein